MLDIKGIIKYTSPLKLLYVEDNEDSRVSTMIILEEFFEDVTLASNGEEALELFKSNDIDLIITDINMPKLDGLEMIEAIREFDAEIIILVLSAYNETNFFIKSIKLDVEGYLLKPIDMKQFLNVLNKIIEKLKLKDEARKNLHLLNQYQEIADKSSIISKSDLSGKITYVNDAFCQISEYSREELLGRNHNIIRHPDVPASLYSDMWDSIQNKKKIWQGTIRNINKSGNSYYVTTTVKPILDKDENILEYISMRNDITDIMNPKRQIQDLVDDCKESIVVILKIEGFDDIEKFYGLKISQKVEKAFSREILKFMPVSCEFGRVFLLGDGEYGFVKDKNSLKRNTEEVIQNLKELKSSINDAKIDLGEIEYDISIVISVAYGESSLENARYGLKQLNERNRSFIVSNNLIQNEHAQAQKNLEILKMVKRAIDDFKIISYFQPIIDNKTQEVAKYESLVRLIDSNGKVLSPFAFLDVAKRGKYYSKITDIVLDNSFKALYMTDMDISMNISVLDIEKRLTREKIFQLLEEHKEQRHRVVFELLEDENVKDFKLIKSFIERVKEMGVSIAIDDFGAGYSNFERLLDYQPDILKIDGSLVKNIESDDFSRNVVETIVDFAKKQNIRTVAEFVENENIFNILRSLGIDYSQGYYFGKPGVLK